MHYLQSYGDLDGVILQAPVSDREYLVHALDAEDMSHYLNIAKELIESGQGEELLPRKVSLAIGGAPLTASRFWSLAALGVGV